MGNFCTPRMEFSFWSQQEATNTWVCVCTHPQKQPRLLLCLHSHKKKKIIGLHVRADQEFLPSQSGPISWKLTCALTPLRGGISEHGNTKSGKRKTLIDFTCFLMRLPQGPAVLQQLHALPPLPSEADTATVLWSNGFVFSPVPQVAAHADACSGSKRPARAHWLTDGLSDWCEQALPVSKTIRPFLHAAHAAHSDNSGRFTTAHFYNNGSSISDGGRQKQASHF